MRVFIVVVFFIFFFCRAYAKIDVDHNLINVAA